MEIDVSKCPYKGGLECYIRDYPIEYCADVRIEDCHYKQLHRYKQAIEDIKDIAEKIYKAYEICGFGCDSCEAKQIIQKCEEVDQ